MFQGMFDTGDEEGAAFTVGYATEKVVEVIIAKKLAEAMKGYGAADDLTDATRAAGGNISDDIVLKGTEYTPEYAQKLKDTYRLIKNNGYEVSEHGLNRIIGRINQGEIGSIDDVIDVLNNGTKYVDTVNGGTILYKDGISIHIADDGFIKTVIGKAKVKSTWEIVK